MNILSIVFVDSVELFEFWGGGVKFELEVSFLVWKDTGEIGWDYYINSISIIIFTNEK